MRRWMLVLLSIVIIFGLTTIGLINYRSNPELKESQSLNTPATMVFNKLYRVGFDRDGNMLNPASLNLADVTRANAGGKGVVLFPWQKPGIEVWGRPSEAGTNFQFELERILPTTGHNPFGRDIPANRDFNNNYTIDQYAFWTEVFLTVKPTSGASQEIAHWYAVITPSGNLYLDLDGTFNPNPPVTGLRYMHTNAKGNPNTTYENNELIFLEDDGIIIRIAK